MADEIAPGLSITRTPIFEADTQVEYDWHKRLLAALASVRALGVVRCEIEIRDSTYEAPVVRTVARDSWTGHPINEIVGNESRPTQRIVVYAIRVDGAS